MKNFLKILNKIFGKIYLLFAIVVVVFAILMSVARMMTPILTHYKGNLTTLAESYLHNPIKIGQIKATWRGFQPVLDFTDVSIYAKGSGQEVFKIEDLQVGFDIIASIMHHKVIVSRLYLKGMHLVLEQGSDLSWSAKGFAFAENKNAAAFSVRDTISWVLSQPELVLENINLKIQPYQKKLQVIQDLDLILTNSDVLHQLRGQANLLSHHSPVDLAIDLRGNPDDVDHLTGEFYLHGTKTPFVDWLDNKQFLGFTCDKGDFSFQLWGTWQADTINNLQGIIDFSDLNFIAKDKVSVNIQNLQANLLFNKLAAQSWLLSGNNIQLTIDHHVWPTAQFMLQFAPTTSGTTLAVNYVQLQDLGALFANLSIIPQQFRTLSKQLKLQGTLKDVQGQWSNVDKVLHYHFVSAFTDFSNAAYKKLPGIAGLSGSVNVSEQAGQVNLQSTTAVLNYPQLFRQPFAFNNMQLSASWQHHEHDVQIQVPLLKVADNNVKLDSQLTLLLADQSKKSQIHLLGRYHVQHLENAKLYFPVGIMQKSLIQWLDQAFIAGKQADGGVLVTGALNAFPYVKNEGQFIIDADLQQLQFNFAPNWQPITQLSGDLQFHKNAMQFTATKGLVAQQSIMSLTANIPDMAAEPQAKLFIDGHIKLDQLAVVREFLLQSPLKSTLGKKLLPLHFQGKGQLHLKLIVPLNDLNVKTDGVLQINNADLAIPDWKLDFKNLLGVLHFTDDSLAANALQTTFLNQPIKINIATVLRGRERYTQFTTDIMMQISDIKKYFSLPKLDFIHGAANMHTMLDINSKGDTHLVLLSHLAGVGIDLPEPFNKPSAESRTFQVDAYLKDNDPPLIRFTYADLAGAIIAFAKQKGTVVFNRAAIHLGDGGYLLQKQSGIYISGHLQQFNYADWDAFYQKYLQVNASDSVQPTPTPGTNSPLIKQVNLEVVSLNAFKQTLKNVSLQLNQQIASWLVNIRSDKITGSATIPLDYRKQAIKAEFSALNLTALTDDKNAKLGKFEPNTITPLQISANEFSYAGTVLGKIQLSLQPIANGMQIDQLAITNERYSLTTHGRWTRNNGVDNSAFSGSLATDNVGKLLKEEDFTSHLDKGKGSADFNLSWPASPSNFQTKALEGSLKLNFSDGAIVGLNSDINKKIGLGKLINILSIQSIFRRLTLNFSDLDESGYTYTALTGDLSIANGKVATQNLYLNGPVAELYLKGSVGIQKQTYDVDLTVNPYVASSLPIIATIAGGPIAGVATWAVSKIARETIEKAVAYQYHIGGTWKDPVIVDLNEKKE